MWKHLCYLSKITQILKCILISLAFSHVSSCGKIALEMYREISWAYINYFYHERHCLTLWRLHLKIVELWCLCCMMMFRWTIKLPGIQKFWNLCSLYRDIYDWISPLNKRSGIPFILTQQSMGRNEYVISGHLHNSLFLKHLKLMVLLSCNFFKASFLHLIKDTDSM